MYRRSLYPLRQGCGGRICSCYQTVVENWPRTTLARIYLQFPLNCGDFGSWLGLLAFGAQAETPSRSARVGTDDTARPVPASLANEVNRLFDTRMPASIVEKATVFRCFDGHVLVCTAGANLPCGKANVSRINPGAAAWCRDHPGAASVPAFATGHDTIYEWRCHGGQAEAFRQVDQVDARGFFARYWKQLR